MSTTIMRDSIVGDQWIAGTYAAAPPQRILDEKTGNFLTGPVRLAFVHLFEPQKRDPTPQNPNPGETYNTMILFPPMTDFTIFNEEYYARCASDWASAWNPDAQNYIGLHSPFHDQVEKSAKYQGFTPNSKYITISSQFKSPIVDARGNAIVDPAKAYAGAWAICAVNAYAYGKKAKGATTKGVGFGIQSVMLIGDDTRLDGGGGVDPQAVFKGINVQAPIARPDFSKMPQGLPGGGPVIDGTSRPVVPSTHYVPPPPPVAQSDDDFMSQFQ